MSRWLERVRVWFSTLKIPFSGPSKTGSQEFKPKAHPDHALVLSVTEPKQIPRFQQWRFFERALDPGERKIFWGSLLAALLFFGLGGVSLMRGHTQRVPGQGGSMTEALIGSPKLINPLFAGLNDVDRDLSALIYSSLFHLDANLMPQPDLVEQYHWLDNGKTLEITLRKFVVFHDGQPLTADDVVFTYQAIKTWKSPLLNNFRNVNVLRVDDQTIQFQLPKANPSFLNLLTVGIMPAHIWEDLSDVNAMLTDANLKPIGSGPYQALSFTRDSKGFIFSYHLRAWPKYYGIAPFIKDVTFRFYGDRVQAQNALRGNQVDTLAFVPWGDVATIKNKNVHSLKLELPQETVAFFNTKDAVLKDERLRTALSMAIDHHELQDLIGAHATLINSPFPFLEATTSTPENLEGARALLQSMGWILNAGETVRHFVPVVVPKSTKKTASVTTSSTPLTLTIDVPEQPDLLKVADFLKRRWSLLGIQVAIQSTDPESLLRQILNDRSYQIVVWNILLPETQDLTPFWNSGSATGNGLNLSNLQDRDVDNALNALNNVTSTEGLLSARLRLANTILARVPALFLLRPAYAYMVSNRVLGTSDERISRPADRLRNMNTWYIKTDLRWK